MGLFLGRSYFTPIPPASGNTKSVCIQCTTIEYHTSIHSTLSIHSQICKIWKIRTVHSFICNIDYRTSTHPPFFRDYLKIFSRHLTGILQYVCACFKATVILHLFQMTLLLGQTQKYKLESSYIVISNSQLTCVPWHPVMAPCDPSHFSIVASKLKTLRKPQFFLISWTGKLATIGAWKYMYWLGRQILDRNFQNLMGTIMILLPNLQKIGATRVKRFTVHHFNVKDSHYAIPCWESDRTVQLLRRAMPHAQINM